MDDYYAECRDKVKNSTDPASAIDELLGISIHDLPRMQLCQFAEQTVTLLSIIFQIAACPAQDRAIKFKQIRQQLDATLNYMEQIIVAEKEFPSTFQEDGRWW